MKRGTGRDPRGYVRVYLGKGHPLANSGGWQWRHRLKAAESLGRRLLKCEQVHHKDSRLVDGVKVDEPWNLEVLLSEYHGRIHAWQTLLAIWRGPDGRFVELNNPMATVPAVRRGPIIGPAALRAPL